MITFVSATILIMSTVAITPSGNIDVSTSSIEMGTLNGCHFVGKKWMNSDVSNNDFKITKSYQCIQEVIYKK